ncbi:hypothetical protein [Nostoc sp.]
MKLVADYRPVKRYAESGKLQSLARRKKILGYANSRVRVLCLQHNKLTNKNRAIAVSAKLCDRLSIQKEF